MWANTPVQRTRVRSIQPPQGSILKATLSRAPLHHIVYGQPQHQACAACSSSMEALTFSISSGVGSSPCSLA